MPVVRARRVPARRAVLYYMAAILAHHGARRSPSPTCSQHTYIRTLGFAIPPSSSRQPQSGSPSPAGPSPHDFHLPLLLHLHFLSLEQRPTERPNDRRDRTTERRAKISLSTLHFTSLGSALLRPRPSASASASLSFPEKPRRTTGATDGS